MYTSINISCGNASGFCHREHLICVKLSASRSAPPLFPCGRGERCPWSWNINRAFCGPLLSMSPPTSTINRRVIVPSSWADWSMSSAPVYLYPTNKPFFGGLYDLLDGIHITAKCIINNGHIKVHLGVNVKLISIFYETCSCVLSSQYSRDVYECIIFYGWNFFAYRFVLRLFGILLFFCVFRTSGHATRLWWLWCVSVSASASFSVLSESSRPALFPQSFTNEVHLIISPLWIRPRCFSTNAEPCRCSPFSFSFARLCMPSENVDWTFVGMTRSAARRVTTPRPSPVASSSWTTPTTTSRWSPGNFLGCLLCCFSSLRDTLSSECCVPDPGSSPRLTADTQQLPLHRIRSWRAVHRLARWIRLLLLSCPHTKNANACRHMKKRCAMGAEDGRSTTWDKLQDEEVSSISHGFNMYSTFEVIFVAMDISETHKRPRTLSSIFPAAVSTVRIDTRSASAD